MTLVVGIHFDGGVVLASDSQMTAGGGATSVRLEGEKVEEVGSHLLIGSSGGLDLSQRIVEGLVAIGPQLLPALPRRDIVDLLDQVVRPVQTAAVHGHVPYPGTSPSVWSGLFAGWSDVDGPWLLSYGSTGASEFRDEHASVGSAFSFGHFALVGVDHVMPFTLDANLGKAVAYRAIENTCRAAASFVGLPVQMGKVTENGVKILDDEEVQAVNDTVNLWKQGEAEILWGMGSGGVDAWLERHAAEDEATDEDHLEIATDEPEAPPVV